MKSNSADNNPQVLMNLVRKRIDVMRPAACVDMPSEAVVPLTPVVTAPPVECSIALTGKAFELAPPASHISDAVSADSPPRFGAAERQSHTPPSISAPAPIWTVRPDVDVHLKPHQHAGVQFMLKHIFSPQPPRGMICRWQRERERKREQSQS
jgi:hypothetical protein